MRQSVLSGDKLIAWSLDSDAAGAGQILGLVPSARFAELDEYLTNSQGFNEEIGANNKALIGK